MAVHIGDFGFRLQLDVAPLGQRDELRQGAGTDFEGEVV
jgi:hypothetical protein